MFGENRCNASGNRLLSFLNEVELMICNGRKLVSEPESTLQVPYSGKLCGSEPSVKVFSTEFCGCTHVIIGLEQPAKVFSAKFLFCTEMQTFSSSKVSRYVVYRIALIFRGSKFSRIAVFLKFR